MIRTLKKIVPRPLIKLYHLVAAVLALIHYRNPSRDMVVIGITGTDGKTTTSYMVYEILKAAGKAVSLVTSVGVIYHGREGTEATGLHATTPAPFEIQGILAEAKASGTEFMVLETTSHGLDQFRVFGIDYTIGAVTNITHEHLDYHRTWDAYMRAKAKLLRGVEASIINRDDEAFEPLRQRAEGELITYGVQHPAELTASSIQLSPQGITFEVSGMSKPVTMQLLGEYNVYNALAAIAIAQHLRIPDEAIYAGLGALQPPPGRLERVDMGQDFTVFVDFAHTSNSLDTMLRELSRVKGDGRVIVVFGCAGERDPFKRFPMGASAGRYADLTVITAEDPRSEDLNAIMEQIAEGVESEGGVRDETYFLIGDRRQAIHTAICELAQPGDIVVTTGKAHEQSMNYDGLVETPWDEFEAVRSALRARATPVGG
ncbi:MAG: Mur ligase family protein [Anaerolineae bacterium]